MLDLADLCALRMDSVAVLHQNLAIARDFCPLTPNEMDTLRRRCTAAAGDGHLELYKLPIKYDSALGRT